MTKITNREVDDFLKAHYLHSKISYNVCNCYYENYNGMYLFMFIVGINLPDVASEERITRCTLFSC